MKTYINELKFTIVILFIGFVVMGIMAFFTSNARYEAGYAAGYAAGYDHIKSIAELQEQVGAEPDGIWGQETTRLYDIAYCDQEAVKMFERMSK